MKRPLLIIAAVISIATCVAQDKMFITAGTTFSTIKGMEFKLKDQFGYYAGLGLIEPIDKYQAFVADFNYIYQRASNEMIRHGSQSLNLSVNYSYTPFDFKLNLLAGIQMGFVMNSKIKMQDSIIRDRDVRFSGIGGLSYDFNKLSVTARYNRKFDGSDIFDSALLIGVTHKINYK